MSDLPYDPKPAALELRVLPEGGSGAPEFIWAVFTLANIAACLPMRTGLGCVVTLNNGTSLLCSNHYSDVAEALVGNAKRFKEDSEIEDRVLLTVVPESEDEDDEDDEDDDGVPSESVLDFLESAEFGLGRADEDDLKDNDILDDDPFGPGDDDEDDISMGRADPFEEED